MVWGISARMKLQLHRLLPGGWRTMGRLAPRNRIDAIVGSGSRRVFPQPSFPGVVTIILLLGMVSVEADETEEEERSFVHADEIIESLNLGEPVELIDAIIIGTLDFSQVTDRGLTESGDPAPIDSRISIRSSIFRDPVRGRVTFAEALQFRSNTFEEQIDLRGSKFVGPADLSTNVFAGPVMFSKCQFNEIDFTNSEFQGPVSFDECRFNYGIDFSNASFEFYFTAMSFSRAIFVGDAIFRSVGYPSVDFSEAEFRDALDLQSARINGLDLRGATIARPQENSSAEFAILNIDQLTDLDFLGLSEPQLVRYLTRIIQQEKVYPYQVMGLEFLPNQLPSYQEAGYLSFVARRKAINNLVARYLDMIFLDLTVGYGYKPSRLVLWVLGVGGAFFFNYVYHRRRNVEAIERERREKYPAWESRIDREFVGESAVSLDFVPKRHRDFVLNEYWHRHDDLELVRARTRSNWPMRRPSRLSSAIGRLQRMRRAPNTSKHLIRPYPALVVCYSTDWASARRRSRGKSKAVTERSSTRQQFASTYPGD